MTQEESTGAVTICVDEREDLAVVGPHLGPPGEGGLGPPSPKSQQPQPDRPLPIRAVDEVRW